jgi:hypothetical protein
VIPVRGVVTDTADDDGLATRTVVGLRTEWMCYYTVNTFVNALFIITALITIGVVQ